MNKLIFLQLLIVSPLFSIGSFSSGDYQDLQNAKRYQNLARDMQYSTERIDREATKGLAYSVHFQELCIVRNIQLIVDNCHAITPYAMAATLASIFCDKSGRVVGIESFYDNTGVDTDAEIVKALETWNNDGKNCESCQMLKKFLEEKARILKKELEK